MGIWTRFYLNSSVGEITIAQKVLIFRVSTLAGLSAVYVDLEGSYDVLHGKTIDLKIRATCGFILRS